MNNAEVQRLLDGLDRRLALGEIDIGTYNQIKAKFSKQFNDSQEPIATAISSLPKEAIALKCPGCMAPLPLSSSPSQDNLICEYCGGTFTLQTATEEMERLRSDIRKWISQVAGNVGIGTTIDEASRKFIFNDKLLPTLRTATDRATEMMSMIDYQSLFAFPLLNKLPSSPFHQAVQMTPDLNFLINEVKETVARVQSPEIKIFALGEREKYELQAMEVQCLKTSYLSNARHHLANFTPDGIQKAKTNLRALAELYDTAGQLSLSVDPSYARFSSALASRMKAVEQAIDIVSYLLSDPEGVMTNQIVGNLESIATQCEQAATDIEASGKEPKESVPAAEGTRIDAQTIRVLISCVQLYGQCGAETGERFTGFLATLEQAVDQAKDSSSDLIWLSTFLSQAAQHINSITGEASLPVVSDFGWVEGRMVTLVRSSLFSDKESAESEKKILMPFWLAELDFSQQKGVIFKKGQAVQGLIFLEAGRHNRVCYVVPVNDPLSVQCYNAIKTPTSLGRSVPAIVPIVGPDAALRHMKLCISTTKGYIGGSAKLLGLLYLPVSFVRYYTKKSERREALAPSANIQITPFEMKPLHLGTRELQLIK